ncbi:MBL fold metallo-hydrolase [Hyphomonas sp.]|uniref:MBL fold metallo-hydrolase n=1 Tax=Hyphomonas sp. TaxID=87 RepID=UPI00391AB7BD
MRWIIRGLMIVALAGAVVLGGLHLLQPQIAEMAFRRALSENIARDRSTELPDGLHVFVCGAGSPMPDPYRAGPCLGILAGERAFLIDAGSGGARNLARMGFPTGKLEGIYLTHLHSDHIDGLGETLMQAWIAGGRTEPLTVTGPVGTSEVVAGFNAAYRIDSGYRTAHHGVGIADPAGFGGAAAEVRLPAGPGAQAVLLEDADLKIVAFAVDHAPVEPAFGFRIDYRGRSAVISGDTVYHPGLVGIARGADLLLHEALEPDMVRAMSEAAAARGADRLATVFADILDYHASPADAVRAATEAGVGHLVLVHIVPPLPSRMLDRRFIGEAGRGYQGKLTLARDGLLVSLPEGSDRVSYTPLFR